ncbi:MAG: CHASE2 domain-containing protein [Devosia sp.]
MALRLGRVSIPLSAGMLLSIGAALVIHFAPVTVIPQLRERVFDALSQLKPVAVVPEVLVVDIDQRSDDAGENAWSRAKTAQLVESLAAAGAAVIAFDLVFSAACDPGLPENLALTRAMRQVPVVLGFFLSDLYEGSPAPRPPLAIRSPVVAPDLWFADSAEQSCYFFDAAAASTGVISLAGDSDARIRLAPAVAVVADAPYPGLALEALRIGKGWPIPIFGGEAPMFSLGPLTVPLDAGANLRFRATGPETWAQRTVSAADVLAGTVPIERLRDAIVFAGSSRPQMGGLRPTASSPLEPSVQIHADIAVGLLAGSAPYRDPRASMLEAFVAGLAGGLVTILAVLLRPTVVLVVAAAAALAWAAAAVSAYWFSTNLIDPLHPAITVLAAYAVASLLHYAATRRAEENLRRRFGQHLPPAIVSRFVENPSLMKLEGEERVVTALFTDIEGFAATTRLAGPRELISMLDLYLGGVARIVTAHGGMVDKFVGDAVHAFFNAPLDLDAHTDKAIASALEIVAFTEVFRQLPENARFGFGRTRIGIEAGATVVGDVGAGGKIDYTAHGNAVNLAARLEAANKELGTVICIGPGARGNASTSLASLGEIEIRGFGRLEVFTPAAMAPGAGADQTDVQAQSPTLA